MDFTDILTVVYKTDSSQKWQTTESAPQQQQQLYMLYADTAGVDQNRNKNGEWELLCF